MTIQQNSNSKSNGINLLGAIVLGFFSLDASSSDTTFTPPHPRGNLGFSLIERPSPVSVSIYNMPIQKAVANYKFTFNLKPYIGLSRTEIGYSIVNGFYNHHTIDIMGVSLGISGMPKGLIQISNRPGDCPSPFYLGSGAGCTLHFYVDRDQYTSAEDGTGPYVLMNIQWKWGHHYRYPCDMNVATTVFAPNRIYDLLTPIMFPTRVLVTPAEQDGLRFDQATSSIVGTPTRTGVYHFKISATNGTAAAAPSELEINVSTNPLDKPVFKTSPNVASAMPEKEYRLNLMDLLEPTKGFMETNQITFELDENHPILSWLKLDKNNGTVLRGEVPKNAAGQTQEITINAISNTGGKSEPFLLKIPVAYDPAQKPILDKDLKLSASAGNAFHNDLRSSITDPTSDGNIKLIIEKIEPKAPWLTVSNSNPTELTGVVPPDAVGQSYQITLRANTTIGGSSEPETIPLNIAINKEKTPRFYQDNPQLPLLYAGQPYLYDFVANNDVDPEYSEIPYNVELAEDQNNPDWVRIEDNKLIVDQVPSGTRAVQPLYITVKNIPGGTSKIFSLKLFIMN